MEVLRSNAVEAARYSDEDADETAEKDVEKDKLTDDEEPSSTRSLVSKGKQKEPTWKGKSVSALTGDERKRYMWAMNKQRQRNRKSTAQILKSGPVRRTSRPINTSKHIPTEGSSRLMRNTRDTASTEPFQQADIPQGTQCPGVQLQDNNQLRNNPPTVADHLSIKIQAQAIADQLQQRLGDHLKTQLNFSGELEEMMDTFLGQRERVVVRQLGNEHSNIIKSIETELREPVSESRQVLKRLKRLEEANKLNDESCYERILTRIDEHQSVMASSFARYHQEVQSALAQHERALQASLSDFKDRLLREMQDAQKSQVDMDIVFSTFKRLRKEGFLPVAPGKHIKSNLNETPIQHLIRISYL